MIWGQSDGLRDSSGKGALFFAASMSVSLTLLPNQVLFWPLGSNSMLLALKCSAFTSTLLLMHIYPYPNSPFSVKLVSNSRASSAESSQNLEFGLKFKNRALQLFLDSGLSHKSCFRVKPELNCLPAPCPCSWANPYKEVSRTVFQQIKLGLVPFNWDHVPVSILANQSEQLYFSQSVQVHFGPVRLWGFGISFTWVWTVRDYG